MTSGQVIVGIILLIRLFVAATRRNGRSGESLGGRAVWWAGFVYFVLVPFAITLVFRLLGGQLWTAPALLPLLVLIAPWPIAQSILIPLGLPRAAFYVTALSAHAWQNDRAGGAALACAWALCRARRPDHATIEWIEQRLNAGSDVNLITSPTARPTPLRGGGVAAAALLAALRRDVEGARALFDAVLTIDARACPAEARRVAAGWLAADAASRGDWERVADLSAAQRSRALGLLGAVAARLLDRPDAPGAIALWMRWAAAPRRRATLPLVRRALAAQGAARPEPEEPEVRAAAIAEGDLWSRAVLLHTRLLLRRGRRIAGDDLRRLGGAWDAALEDERAQAELCERARALGASGAQAALGPLRRAVQQDLSAVARAAALPHAAWSDLGATVGGAARLLRDDLLSEIELSCDACRRRVDDRRELPAPEEWRAWTALRTQVERAVAMGGMELRRLAFTKVHPDVCHLAVWLFNARKERPLANAMFRWLLAEAEALDDTRAVALQQKNIDCGV